MVGCRNPLRKAPEQMPGEQPARRGDEQTQPQPGEASAFMDDMEGEDSPMPADADQVE